VGKDDFKQLLLVLKSVPKDKTRMEGAVEAGPANENPFDIEVPARPLGRLRLMNLRHARREFRFHFSGRRLSRFKVRLTDSGSVLTTSLPLFPGTAGGPHLTSSPRNRVPECPGTRPELVEGSRF